MLPVRPDNNHEHDTLKRKVENGRHTVVLVGRSALERVVAIRHHTEDKYSSFCDCSVDQVFPPIRRFWIAVC